MTHSVENFFKYSELLASGAQPNVNQITDLATDGYEVIINISPSTAKNALTNEAELVEKTGMDYVHFPVDCSNLRPIHYKLFEGIMNGVNAKKIFVHCGGNIKSSNLIHMYNVISKGMDEQESLKMLYKIQNPDEKWFSYFKLMGMNGLK